MTNVETGMTKEARNPNSENECSLATSGGENAAFLDNAKQYQHNPVSAMFESNQASDPPTAAVVDACAHRLEVLAERSAQFLRHQFAQLADTYGQVVQAAQTCEELEQSSRELHRQQAAWEQTKAEEAERIAEEIEMLTAAWDQIEDQRRQLASVSESIPLEQTTTQPSATPPFYNSSLQESMFGTDISGTGRSAALQFQQIKREISRHATSGSK